LTFGGTLIGYLLFSFSSDNFGRKKTMDIGWGIAVLGYSLIVFAQNIYMAIAGVLVIGFGADAVTAITINFIN
jgi:MFS family permease